MNRKREQRRQRKLLRHRIRRKDRVYKGRRGEQSGPSRYSRQTNWQRLWHFFAALMLPILGYLAWVFAGDIAREAGRLVQAVERNPQLWLFLPFVCTLAGITKYHHQAKKIAAVGLAVCLALKYALDPSFSLVDRLNHEWVLLSNVVLLICLFPVVAKWVEHSRLPALMPRWLPSGWAGAFCLLLTVFLGSIFLDNIAAGLIGSTIAKSVFGGLVHPSYITAIVGSSNAGGSPSVIGDTTTTMMWLKGVLASNVLHAFFPAFLSLLISGGIASWQQNKLRPIQVDPQAGVKIAWRFIPPVIITLSLAIGTNVYINSEQKELAEALPWIGMAVAGGLLLSSPIAKPEIREARKNLPDALFLACLIMAASLMPVQSLPEASPMTAFVLGLISPFFDNIPLTSLALNQGGYDWGQLAFAVGYAGSATWFGSVCGVTVTAELFPESRKGWIRHGGWHIILAYVVSYWVSIFVFGWHPQPIR